MDSITDYIKEKGITVEIVAGPAPSTEDGWNHYMYQIQLKRSESIENDLAAGGEVASPDFIWNQGTAIETSPDKRPDEVLDAMVSDALSYLQARDFEDFASELGYDSDSRKAEKIYKACGETAEWLRVFLNGDLDYVAYELERL